ncbi:MAG: EF-hand domain-containing protein [Pseudomonadota bacterium]
MPHLPSRLAGAFAAAALLAAAPPAAADELAEAFAAADLDGNGYLNVDEYVAAVVLRFGELDADGDGMLSLSEVPDADPDEFAEADRDGDGLLSLGEAVGDRMMRFFDAGGDQPPHGVVTLDELRAHEAGRS